MSREYVIKKVEAALDQCDGDEVKAMRLLMAWSHEDSKLLTALTAPHMKGIIGHAVRYTTNLRQKEQEQAEHPADPDPFGADGGEFGVEILKAIAGGKTARFGLESGTNRPKKQAASQQHIDAIRQIVEKSGE